MCGSIFERFSTSQWRTALKSFHGDFKWQIIDPVELWKGKLKTITTTAVTTRTTCCTWRWAEITGGSLTPFAFTSFSTSVHDKQTYLSALCPASPPLLPHTHTLYLPAFFGSVHTLQHETIKWEGRQSLDKEVLSVQWVNRRQCTQNLHYFQESKQMLLHIAPKTAPSSLYLYLINQPSLKLFFCLRLCQICNNML